MLPANTDRHVSCEAIYNALYLMPSGSLKKEMIACLRQGNGKRRPRYRGKGDDNRFQARSASICGRLGLKTCGSACVPGLNELVEISRSMSS
mgnify:CR=1 FL=1